MIASSSEKETCTHMAVDVVLNAVPVVESCDVVEHCSATVVRPMDIDVLFIEDGISLSL